MYESTWNLVQKKQEKTWNLGQKTLRIPEFGIWKQLGTMSRYILIPCKEKVVKESTLLGKKGLISDQEEAKIPWE